MSEILDELSKLERSEREKVWQRLEELELAELEETPEMLQAIDAGRRSRREGKTHPVEQARELIAHERDFCCNPNGVVITQPRVARHELPWVVATPDQP